MKLHTCSLHPVLVIFLLCFSSNAFTQVTLQTPNETVTGEEIFVVCTFCHGGSVQGNDRRDGPALAGLEAWYLELQMHNFKNGVRGYLAEDVPGQVMHFPRRCLETILLLKASLNILRHWSPASRWLIMLWALGLIFGIRPMQD